MRIPTLALATLFALSGRGHGASVHCAVDAERVTMRVREAPARVVLDDLSRAAAVRVRWLYDGGDELLSIDINGLEVADAIERLLAHRNHTIAFREDGSLTVDVGSRQSAAGATVPEDQVSSTESSEPTDVGPNSDGDAEATAMLPALVATGEVTAAQLAELARTDTDTELAAVARGLLQMLAGSDPEALTILDTLLRPTVIAAGGKAERRVRHRRAPQL